MDEGLLIMCIVTFIVLYVRLAPFLSSLSTCHAVPILVPHMANTSILMLIVPEILPFDSPLQLYLSDNSFCAIIYCFLSTCIGVQIRRSDMWDAVVYNSRGAKEHRRRQLEGRRSRPGTGGVGEREEYELVERREPLVRKGF
jgi:hypothetical protein